MQVFSSLGVLASLRKSLGMTMYYVPTMIRAKVSLDRVDCEYESSSSTLALLRLITCIPTESVPARCESCLRFADACSVLTTFTLKTEVLDRYAGSSIQPSSETPGVIVTSPSTLVPRPNDQIIGFHKATFAWSAFEALIGTATPTHRTFKLRVDDLIFKGEVLNLIVGPTGCGKTSLLLALLGEMHFEPRGIDSWFRLPRDKGIAYCAQEAWLTNDTIKVT